ncbi:rCG41252 [Rattus norvegicus]|uniref:RCG41252 n=1 Tax=Rattus norvegicus TaxID=10116 RepID=A6KNF3_RAT|nr:rCG41252 [Rattus norvegicus]
MFFTDFLESSLYNNINEFLFLRHLKANLSTSKNSVYLESNPNRTDLIRESQTGRTQLFSLYR